ncbi:MAG: hypothetical protein K2H38_03330 [Muribaculaceae bacterium]|nr:hypothetical protein [Muribaculaceae bacterium]
MKASIVIAAALSVILSGSCNRDVFTDGPILPDHTEVTINGDGGEATFETSFKDLQSIKFQLSGWMVDVVYTCFDRSGKEISLSAPLSEVYRMVAQTPFSKLEIFLEGKRILVKSISNALSDNLKWNIQLEYSYCYKTIDVSATPGAPLMLLDVSFGSIFSLADKPATERLRIENRSDRPLATVFYPYLNQQPTVDVSPKDAPWLTGSVIEMPVPVCNEYGEWTLSGKTEVKLGYPSSYDGPDPWTEVKMTIPPEFSGIALTTVNKATAETSGILTYFNERLDLKIDIPFNCLASYPISYSIDLIPD